MTHDLQALAEKARAADTERARAQRIGAERTAEQMRAYADRAAALSEECRRVVAALRSVGAITEAIIQKQDGFTRWTARPKPDLIIPGWLLISPKSGDREEMGHDGLAIAAENGERIVPGELMILDRDSVYSRTWDASRYLPHRLAEDDPFGEIREALGRLLARYDADRYL